MADKHN